MWRTITNFVSARKYLSIGGFLNGTEVCDFQIPFNFNGIMPLKTSAFPKPMQLPFIFEREMI